MPAAAGGRRVRSKGESEARHGRQQELQAIAHGRPSPGGTCIAIAAAALRGVGGTKPSPRVSARACDPYVPQAFRPWVASLTRALRFKRAGRRTEAHSGPRKQPGVSVRSPTEMSNSPAVDRDGRDSFRAFALSWEHSGRRLRAKAKGHVCCKRANARLSSGSSARSGQASGCREAHHSNSYPNMTRTRSRSLSLVNPKAPPT